MKGEKMKLLSDIYKRTFFGRRHKLEWRAPILCDAIIHTTGLKPPRKIIDVGCATGEFIAEFNKRGYDATGIEGSATAFEFIPEEIKDYVVHFDLRKEYFPYLVTFPNDIAIPNDIAMCMEVAEHIEEKYSSVFVKNLCSLSDYVMMSAAPPGQKGHYHVNCQHPEYWEEKFKVQGYKRDLKHEIEFEVFMHPWIKKKGLSAYCQNTLIFRKESR